MAERTVHVFTGPTLSAEEVLEIAPGARVRPPVAHGDLMAGDIAAGDVVVIVDGLYHQQASVRHKEILELLDRGVHVVGCSSMGALRAAELHPCGMVGSGAVFEMYRDGIIDADDEVAVVHGREGRLSTRNVPLVAVRWATRAAHEAGVLTPAQAEAVVTACRSLHYTDRSWPAIRHALGGPTAEGYAAAGLDALLAFLEEHPEHAAVKRRDAVATLRRLPELTAAPPRVRAEGPWRNPHVFAWDVEHRVSGEPGEPGEPGGPGEPVVTDALVLRHQQVYRPDFPDVWRRFVVDELVADLDPTAVGTPGAEPLVVERWAPVLRLGERPDSPALIPREAATLGPHEAVLRTLVRCYDPPRGLHDLRRACPDLLAAPDVRRSVREALDLNATTWWRQRERLVDRLPAARLRRHLAQLWGCSPTPDELAAAARDRGLRDVDTAVAAVRTTFLRDESAAGGATARWRTS